MESELMTVKEAAALLGTSTVRVYDMIAAHRLRTWRPPEGGRPIRLWRSDIQAMAEEWASRGGPPWAARYALRRGKVPGFHEARTSIGRRLKEIRLSRGLTPTDLAGAAGFESPQTVHRLEGGHHAGSLAVYLHLEKAAGALGLAVTDLWPHHGAHCEG